MSGVPIRSEMLSDIPGFTWGLVDALARNGIKYLSIGPNFGHRIGHFSEALADRPFYWESSNGKDRVLTWVSGAGYAWFHTGLGYTEIKTFLNEESVFRYLDQLAERGYPYGVTHMRYNIGSDNGPPDPGLSKAVRDWNRRFASPTLRIAGATAMFEAFEERYGKDLPVLRGDMTGYWEDGAASSAKETALVRRTAEALSQTERWASMLDVTMPDETVEEAWRNILLYYEHTWGSWNSVSDPQSDLTVTSWETKAGFARKASELAGELRRSVRDSVAPVGPAEIIVYNTLDWDRSDLVTLSESVSGRGAQIRDDAGEVVPSQRLTAGALVFLASDIPARGSRRYRIEGHESSVDSVSQEGSGGVQVDQVPTIVESSLYRVRLEPESGAIESIVHLPSQRELVAEGGGGLDEYLYVRGRDPHAVETASRPHVRWIERGPLVNEVEISETAPGTRTPLVRAIRVAEGLDWIEIVNRIDKEWVLDPEAVLFRFSFAIEDPQVRIDVPFAVVRPEIDQLPGASKNYYSLERWVNISGPQGAVTLTSIDVPMMQLGEIRTDAVVAGWLEHAEPSSTFLSYAMNNYWETNYRAAQDGPVEFRYAVRAEETYNEVSSDRFGRERASPLIVVTGPAR